MSDLTEFLLARIADDEEAAKATQRDSSYGWSDTAFTEAVELAEGEGAVKAATLHIARWDPARVLAECASKRLIVEGIRDATIGPVTEYYIGPMMTTDNVLRLLALPYANHPDYREEWRP